MARKDAAREIAVAAGVPVVPSYDPRPGGPGPAAYPVLVKAAAGGGGKGMRIVRSAEEYADAAVGAAAREARYRVRRRHVILLEKYVERGRHIEVQVWRTPTATCSTSGSATAPPSAGTRRSSRRRPRRR